MITVVLLLSLPTLLGLTAWRAWTLPQLLYSGQRRVDPRHPWRAAVSLGLAAMALLAGTGWLLIATLQALLLSSTLVQALLTLVRPVLVFPLLCLVFEWVIFYALERPAVRNSRR
jgi:hypothetical protein